MNWSWLDINIVHVVNQELKEIKQSKKMECNVYLHLIYKCTTRMQKLNAHSSEDEENRRPFLSTSRK